MEQEEDFFFSKVDPVPLKMDILQASFPWIAHGEWSLEALEKGAQHLGMDSLAVWRLFPNGVQDAVVLYSEWIDVSMLEKLPISFSSLKVHQKIFWAVRSRLESLALQKDVTLKTTYFLAKPHNLPLSLRLLYEIVHKIWVIGGDTSLDYNFYTKRVLLAGVYGSTYLYWLKDHSLNYEKTWIFLENRIKNVLIIQKIRSLCLSKNSKGS